jgi:peptide/nickel transport system substrate-binding protein
MKGVRGSRLGRFASRRSRALTVLACGLALAAAACSSSSSPAGTAATGAAPGGGSGTSAAPVTGGNLTVVRTNFNWISLDPANKLDFPAWTVGSLLYDSLFTLNAQKQVVPMLATGSTTSNGGKTLTITLRQGVKFQDDTPFNAQAAVFNLKRYASPKVGSQCVSDFSSVTSITAVGSAKVQIDFSAPFSPMVTILATTPCGMMASPTAIQKEGANFGTHPVGSGPFKFVSEVINSSLTVTRWNGYWQKNEPYASNVTFENVASDTVGLNDLQSGQADIMLDAGVQAVTQAKSDSNLSVLNAGSFVASGVLMNNRQAPFNNIDARKALVYATDTASLIKNLYAGLYTQTESPFGPESPGWPGATVPGYPGYDLAKAKALVKQLGGLTFKFVVYNTPTAETEAEALKAQWALAGINAVITPLDETSALGQLDGGTYQALDNFVAPFSVSPDPIVYRVFDSNSPLNEFGLDNSVLDSSIQKARESSDPAEQKQLYAQVSDQVAQLVPVDYLYAGGQYDIVANDVHGFLPSPVMWAAVGGTWKSS